MPAATRPAEFFRRPVAREPILLLKMPVLLEEMPVLLLRKPSCC